MYSSLGRNNHIRQGVSLGISLTVTQNRKAMNEGFVTAE